MLRALRCARLPKGEGRPRRAGRYQRSLIAAALLIAIIIPGGGAGAAQPLHLRCTNPASGTSWQIVVDLDRRRVDALPATITDKSIRWRDPRQGSFDLDRATGRLRLQNASSTGGYFLYYSCQAEHN